MSITEMKNKLHLIVDEANFEQLERMLYVANDKDDSDVPQEWIDEAERVSKAIDNGEMKMYSSDESMKYFQEKLSQFKLNEKTLSH